jgi:hypothetical protein
MREIAAQGGRETLVTIQMPSTGYIAGTQQLVEIGLFFLNKLQHILQALIRVQAQQGLAAQRPQMAIGYLYQAHCGFRPLLIDSQKLVSQPDSAHIQFEDG